MIFRPGLFLKEFFLFSGALAAGIFSANYYALSDERTGTPVQPLSFSETDIIIAIAFFILVSFILFRFKKTADIFFKLFLVLVVFSGSQIIFDALTRPLLGLLLAVLITAVFIFFRNVLIHNIGIIFGIAGISSILGLSISPEVGIIFLVIMSFYDIIAVYLTHHMVHLARGMIESGAIFGFIIPFEFKDFLSHRSRVREKIGERFMVLGSGDVGLPLIMVSSLAGISLKPAIITGLFAIGGLFLTHLIFINQDRKKPMAALPPIATMTIIGYLISLI